MPNICEYTDYRTFLNDYYEDKKSKNRYFSYQIFSEKAGINSKGFIYNVIQGKRNLSKSHIFKLSQAIKLNRYEADYFENLVAVNQAKNLKEQNYFYEKLSSIKSNGKTAWKPQIIRKDQYEFYSQLYHSVIRSLIELYSFKDDYGWLAKNVYPRIKPLQAKKSVELLERLRLIRKQKDGKYKVTNKSISTPKEVASLAVMNFHEEAGKLALNALNKVTKDKRDFSGMTLGISQKLYNEICEDILNLRQKILQKTESDIKADAVYQLNFQFFPVSNTEIERNSQ